MFGAFKRRYATRRVADAYRGLKATATFMASLRDLGGVAERRGECSRGIYPTDHVNSEDWRRVATLEGRVQNLPTDSVPKL